MKPDALADKGTQDGADKDVQRVSGWINKPACIDETACFCCSALLAIAGCGMITHGTSQHIACTTSPAGAVVRSADGTTCTTPCTFTLKRKKDDLLTIEREGYETVTLPVHSALSATSAANVLLPGGLVCWGIDIVSGGGYRLAPDRVDVKLRPVEEEEP